MSRLTAMFENAARLKRTVLIPYITAGFPRPDLTPAIVRSMAEAGADIVELGVPFSDPLADGVTIQRSSQMALDSGVTPAACFDYAQVVRESGQGPPLVLMGYINPILRWGVDQYLATAAAVGVDGLIVPDLPVEEAEELSDACRRRGIDLIFLVAPTSSDARIRLVAERCTGFLYCVSLIGVTGARQSLAASLPEFLARVRRQTDLPLAVGFGIGTPDQAVAVAESADGVAIGSALVDRVGRAPADQAAAVAGEFVTE
ncbi:MAG TPA: tryptophan synthase subunit alpha, partial [Dehalococcoidia bacterium]|nr:tryptophan synthase subunit alpha [Dehalococcoidia bacterium]